MSISTDTSRLADKEELNWPGPHDGGPWGPWLFAVTSHAKATRHVCHQVRELQFPSAGKKNGAQSEAQSGRAPVGRSPCHSLLTFSSEWEIVVLISARPISQERSAWHGKRLQGLRSNKFPPSVGSSPFEAAVPQASSCETCLLK